MDKCPTCGQTFQGRSGRLIAWVIEADGAYWDGKYPDSRGFDKDANRAIRFLDRDAAEVVKHWILQTWAFALRTTQHIWIDGEHQS